MDEGIGRRGFLIGGLAAALGTAFTMLWRTTLFDRVELSVSHLSGINPMIEILSFNRCQLTNIIP